MRLHPTALIFTRPAMNPITQCPKCRHQRAPHETQEPERCPACGLYFEKWLQRDDIAREVAQRRQAARQAARVSAAHGGPAWLQPWLPSPALGQDAIRLRALILASLALWSLQLISYDYRSGEINGSFMHLSVILFHEGGHVLFMPFGQFMTILGGSLFQVLLPLILSVALLWQNRDVFGALVGVWWCGASWLDLAPYIYDAKNPQMIMIGGHTGENGPHDWIYLLGQFNLIANSPLYGALAHKFGVLIIVLALGAGAWWLRRLWQIRESGAAGT